MEVCIMLIIEEEKKYMLYVPQLIYYKYLIDILKNKIFQYTHFQINFRGKTYTKKQ